MEIVDKYGYLEEAIGYLERNIISDSGWPKVLRKIKISKEMLASLSLGIKKISENSLFTLLEDKLEERHSSITGAQAEVYGVDLTIDSDKKKAFVVLTLNFKIVQAEETEDKTTMVVRIYSKENIKVNFISKKNASRS